MRPHCSLVLACAIVLAGGRAAAGDGPPSVRGLDATAIRLLDAARAGSTTFRCLLDRLDHSDLTVYVRFEPRTARPPALTSIVGAAGDRRVVLVTITTMAVEADRFMLLGHELRHAAELADAPEVRDRAGMQALYERIGWHDRPSAYETAAALASGDAVRREMFGAGRSRPVMTVATARASNVVPVTLPPPRR